MTGNTPGDVPRPATPSKQPEPSGVDLARVALRAAKEAARARGDAAQQKKQARRGGGLRSGARADGRDPMALGAAISATGSPVTGGAHSGSFDGLRGCLYDPAPTGMTFDVDWDEGPDSHVVGLAKGEDLGGQSVHTITGAVTGGQFMGSSFEEVINQNSLDLRQCATTGVKSQSGTGFVTITPGAAG
ncbi:hypothetical protein AB0L17_33480 [Streptomyces cellulosae]